MSESYNSPVESVNGPFYLRPEGKCSDDAGATWYLNVFVGHNTLGNTVKRLCRDAGITGNKTNHCLRATTATRGLDVGVPEKMLMERTGHRSVDSLLRYQRPSEEQKAMLSHALDDGKRLSELRSEDLLSLKRSCVAQNEEKEGKVVPMVSCHGNVITFQNCTMNINNFNV